MELHLDKACLGRGSAQLRPPEWPFGRAMEGEAALSRGLN